MEREPDITADPRDISTGQGYPEQEPAGASPTEGREAGPEADVESPDAPSTRSREEASASEATGNPDAAGGGTGRGPGDAEADRPA
jgi:hypothetical protein